MEVYISNIKNTNYDEVLNTYKKIIGKESNSITRLINPNKKKEKMFSELFVKYILVNEYSLDPSEVIFYKNKYGKPYLKNKKLYFNISHSGDYVICLISRSEIGVDIEKVCKIDYLGILEKFFSRNEKRFVLEGSRGSELERFYEIWVMKESYIKKNGLTISLSLRNISVISKGLSYDEVIDSEKVEKCNLKIANLIKGYKIAFCSNSVEQVKKIRILNSKKLFKII